MAPITIPAAFSDDPEFQACAGIRADLANCLLQSNCVLRDGNSPKDCLAHHSDTIPLECQYLRKSLTQCKRGMVSRSKLLAPRLVWTSRGLERKREESSS
jgi:hypothetical protein